MIMMNDCETASQKKRFYAIASKAEWTDRYAKARFDAEPWYITDKRIRERGYMYESDGHESDGGE